METSELNLERLYHPDGHHLGTLVSGLSGSGKTTVLISTLQQAVKHKKFGEFHRFVIVDPKTQGGDYDTLADPIIDLDEAMKSIEENRVTVYWPDIEYLEDDVSAFVNHIFALSDGEPKTSFTFILDEASTLITPTKIPTALKRLAVQGRGKRVKPVFLSQRPIINRWTDANLSTVLLMRTLPVDADVLQKRWGIDFESANEILAEKPYSFLWFDLEKATLTPMNPVPLPKPRKVKKRGTWSRLFDLN